MHSALLTLTGLSLAAAAGVHAQGKSVEQQVTEAVAPLPTSLQDGATVMGYRGSELEVLQTGTGFMVCLADDPAQEPLFHVVCYHSDLEPYMARGRALRKEGVGGNDSRLQRYEEIEAGTLEYPKAPRALHSLTCREGCTFDYEAGAPDGASYLHVLYVPHATQATLGISEQAARDRPWLMFPGTPGAHIMISGARTGN